VSSAAGYSSLAKIVTDFVKEDFLLSTQSFARGRAYQLIKVDSSFVDPLMTLPER
jgi:hypothetical protein